MSQNKDSFIHYKLYQLSSVFSHVWLSATQWLSGCETCMSITNSWSLLKLIELVMPYNHLDLCRSVLLLPSVFPSISVFSNDFVLHIRWPKYWSFSISPFNEYSGLISFRMECFDLLAAQETLKSLLQHHSSKHQFFNAQFSLWSNFNICMRLPEKPQVWVDLSVK